MKKLLMITIITSFILFLNSCEEVGNALDDGELTEAEVVKGLKTALELGTDTATGILGQFDGYYGNQLMRIPLPEDVKLVRNTINGNSTLKSISTSIGLDQKFDDLIKGINHAAENAASEAAPIFKGAISDLSIGDGWDILNGIVPDNSTKSKSEAGFDSTAATQYFINSTYNKLVGLYAPKIDDALDVPISALGFSATDAWTSLTDKYNSFMSNGIVSGLVTLGTVDLPTKLNSDIGGFCTEQALNKLFDNVGEEEKKIRRNPFEWAINIIEKVFGSVFKE